MHVKTQKVEAYTETCMSKKKKKRLMLRHACLKQKKTKLILRHACLTKTKMFTFIKMVINGIENWSPDMIPVAFERKFDERKDEIPPGIYRPHLFDFFNIGDGRTDIKTQKWS